jgi:nicotinamidase-related amidase
MNKFTLTPNDTTLLVIDFQQKLLPAIYRSEFTVKNAGILVEIAKALEMPIIVTEQYPKGIGPTVESLSSLFDDFQPVEKMTFSACTTEVVKQLSNEPRQRILISGIESHVCVFQTVRSLLKKGYQVYVVADAVSSRTEENYRNGLSLMREMGAVITNTETVLFDLLQESTHPKFKDLSKLIR